MYLSNENWACKHSSILLSTSLTPSINFPKDDPFAKLEEDIARVEADIRKTEAKIEDTEKELTKAMMVGDKDYTSVYSRTREGFQFFLVVLLFSSFDLWIVI